MTTLSAVSLTPVRPALTTVYCILPVIRRHAPPNTMTGSRRLMAYSVIHAFLPDSTFQAELFGGHGRGALLGIEQIHILALAGRLVPPVHIFETHADLRFLFTPST